MNGREKGFLLLTSHLGDPERKVMTVAQFRMLAQCVRASQIPEGNGELTERELMALGYNRPSAQKIIDLLSQTELLDHYVREATMCGCTALTRVSEGYPLIVRKRLGLNAPGTLWLKGDQSLLSTPAVSLVGSRNLLKPNLAFACEVGKQAALQGITLVSGNARGADKAAQEACLSHGGSVICVVADSLLSHSVQERVLYISEDAFDAPFTAQRAHSRNRVIHTLGYGVFVAQSSLQEGGTWHGTMANLRGVLSPVRVFDDGSDAAGHLIHSGAEGITMDQLNDISAIFQKPDSLFDR